MGTEKAFTGRARRKKTRISVRLADFLAERLITIGGIGTIAAVCLVFVFLFFVVAPLFQPASLSVIHADRQQPVWEGGDQPLVVRVDEYRTMGWGLFADGRLEIFRADTGEIVDRRRLFGEQTATPITFVAESLGRPDLALGLQDGSLRLGRIAFEVEFRDLSDVSEDVARLNPGQTTTLEQGVVQRTPQGQFRIQKVAADFKPPLRLGASPVRAVDFIPPETDDNPLGSKEYRFVYLLDDGTLQLCTAEEKENLLTLAKTLEVTRRYDLPPASDSPDREGPDREGPDREGPDREGPDREGTDREGTGPGKFLLISGRGDNVFLAWPDGRLVRYDTRKPTEIRVAEQLNVLPDTASELTVCQFLLGRETILCGDDQGHLRGWFRVRERPASATDQNGNDPASGLTASTSADAATVSDPASGVPASGTTGASPAGDNTFRLTMVHALQPHPAAVTTINSSKRNRLVAVGYADGNVRLYQVTTKQMLLQQPVSPGEPIRQVIITPKDDGLIAMTQSRRWQADLDAGHPEATLASLFAPVWYEGYDRPEHLWQSSFADVGPEMKLGLMPLIFGTLKATFYTMLFGTPLALLAAIYTSEFLAPGLRSRIKPSIEMMASLPSVVLGFLAALVFAPVVETMVPATLAAFVTVPVTYLAGAFLWQLVPHRTQLKFQKYRFFLLCPLLAVGLFAAISGGPLIQQWLFAGNIKRWLDGQIGTGTGAWLILLIPVSSLLTAILVGLHVNPWMRRIAHSLDRTRFGLLNALKFLLGTLFMLLLALSTAWLLNAAGLDPRGTFVDTYEQRNALVVGFVMGFAVIPIIYTIADDALATVPSHLRSASLGCGATAWQTAYRVVIPTAMSGLFSALMIGLGRAVGETMIVLMAGGNTPVTEWNVFNGFRTLSANIAVELPEAVRNSTHYRTLFLAALTLFLLTFIVNTVAEIVRLRFRRRAYQL